MERKTTLDDVRRAFEMAAVQAENYPKGHGNDWGKDVNGEWVPNIPTGPDRVGEYG